MKTKQKLRLLFIDPYPDYLALVEQALWGARDQYEVLTVLTSDNVEASVIEADEEEPVDLVFVSWSSRGPDTDELGAMVGDRSEKKRRVIVLFPGSVDVQRSRILFKAGMSDVISKPYDARAVRKMVDEEVKYLQRSRKLVELTGSRDYEAETEALWKVFAPAHRIRNHLDAARSKLEDMSPGLHEDEQQRVAEVDGLLKKCVEIAEQSARPQATYKSTAVPVGDLVQRALTEYVGSPQVTITAASSGGAAQVRIDEEGAVDYLQELLANATHAIQRRLQTHEITFGRIEVTVSKQLPDRVDITVCNNGPAIECEAQERIFEPGSYPSSDEHAGIGLGCARAFFRQQGGDLTLLSTGVEMTCFQVQLPTLPQ